MCVVVGFGGDAETSNTGWVGGLAEKWNGKSWSLQSVPNPPTSSGTGLNSIACRSTTSCIAVGTYYEAAAGGGATPLPLTRWNGSAWSIQPTSSLGGYLAGISCFSTAACTAVGHDSADAFIQHWNGSAWSVSPSLPIPEANSYISPELLGVSCISATACDAVGLNGEAADATDLPLLAERLW